MHGAQEIQAHLNRVLANDSPRFMPCETPEIYEPGESWSGARFIRWNADAGPMVLKIWPKNGPEVSEQRRRHVALQPLRGFTPELALPVPDANGQTLRALPDGRCAELFRWLQGEPVGQDPPEATIRQVMSTLARLHRLWSANFGQRTGNSDGIRQRIQQLRDLESGGLDIAENEVHRQRSINEIARGKLLTIVNLARSVLPVALRTLEPVADSRLPLQIVLRDTRPNHFLTKGENVVGLVDFGAIGFDTVAQDLARIFGEWHRIDRGNRDLAYRAYESIRPLEPAEWAVIEPSITTSAVLGGVAWVDIVCHRELAAGREAALTAALTHAESRLKVQADRYLR